MASMIIWAIAALVLSAVSIYVLLLKKNIRTSGIAVGVGILLPLFVVAGRCISDSQSSSCGLGKANLPYYLAASLITFTPVVYLLATVILYQQRKSRRRYGHRHLTGRDRVRFDSQKVYFSNAAGKRASMSWRRINEIQITRTGDGETAASFNWVLVGSNESRQLEISGDSNGIERLAEHIKQMPGFDHSSFSMAADTESEGSFLLWMRD